MEEEFDFNPLRQAFIEQWRSSLDRHLVDDADALKKSAAAALDEGRKAEAGRLARAALLTAVVAVEACVTDSLEIANEWAGEPFVDVPSHLVFGPSYETWLYLRGRLKGQMNFEDKLFLGFDAIFGQFPLSEDTVTKVREARRLRNKLAHLRSLRDHPDHEVLFDPQQALHAASDAVDVARAVIDEMNEFFGERWRLPRSLYAGDDENADEEGVP